MQKHITNIEDFPKTLREKDSFNRELLPDAMGYLHRMFIPGSLYGIATNASNFAADIANTKYNPETGEMNILKGVKLLAMVGGCHGSFNSAAHVDTSFFINWFYHNTNEPHSRAFLEWIMNPKESPWRDCLQETTILRDPEHDDFPVCIIFRDVKNTHIHLMCSFLIAARSHTEWGQSEMWTKLCDFGFTGAEALCILPNFYVTRNYGPTETYKNLSIFDPAAHNNGPYYTIQLSPFHVGDRPFYADFDSHSVINKQPKLIHEGSLKNQRPNPCNYIWGGSRDCQNPNFLFIQPIGFNPHFDVFGFADKKPKRPNDAVMKEIKRVLNTPASKRTKEDKITLKVGG